MSAPLAAQFSARIVGLVAGREFTTRVMSKAFLISTAVILTIIVGGQIAVSLFSDDDQRMKVGVVGGAPALAAAVTESGKNLGNPVDVRTDDDEEQSRERVAEGDLDVVLIREPGGGYTAVTESEVDPELEAVLDSATQQLALDRALTAQGVDQATLTEAVTRAAITVDAIDPVDPDKDQRVGLAYIAVILLFFTVYLYGIYVAMGVVEEKSSRVVELLLSTIKPLHLLLGKVLGIGAVGLLQVFLFGGAALATGLATGLVTVGSTAIALFASVVVWYVLGFTFFAMLYAAFGSLVSRQEDVNSVTMPLSILAFATFFVAQFSLNDPNTTWISVLAWIPPFSSTLMPMRIAAGVAGPAQVVGTVVIMLVMIAMVAVLAARIYERSVLNTGGKQSWKRALAKTPRAM